MNIILTEKQLEDLSKNSLTSEKKEDACGVFSQSRDKQFCKSVESIIAKNLNTYKVNIRKYVQKFFEENQNEIKNIMMEKLTLDSPIVIDGVRQLSQAVDILESNCPNIDKAAAEFLDKWLSKYSLYFQDANGNYHLMNRLDTNYSAMAYIITLYYQKLLEQVAKWEWLNSEKREFVNTKIFAQDWVDHFFDPMKVPLLDPRQDYPEERFKKDPLKSLPSPQESFDDIVGENDLKVRDSELQKNFLKILGNVRKIGLQTEQIFQNYLDEHGIEYIPYNFDFSFVDMVLGIDFAVKMNMEGKDVFVPVQVKTRNTQPYLLIDELQERANCDWIIRPHLISKKDDEGNIIYDFHIEGVRGFEKYFCSQRNACKN